MPPAPATLASATVVLRALGRLPASLDGLPVLVVAHADDPVARLLRRLLERRLRRRVVTLTPAAGLARRLAEEGPCAAVVDLAGADRWRRRLAMSWFHVARGGVYAQRLRDEQRPDADALARAVRTGRIRPYVAHGAALGPTRSHRRGLLRSLAEPRVVGRFLVARQRADVVLKLGEDDHDRVAAARGLRFEVLAERPAAPYSSLGRMRSSRPHPIKHLGVQVDAPAASLRRHHDVVCLPRQVVVQDSVVLPASFRHPHGRRLHQDEVREVGDAFAHRPDVEPAPLAGTYYHLDNEIPHHFGHLVTEVFSRTWGWAAAREAHPEIKALVVGMPDGAPAPWWYDVLAGTGITRDDLVVAPGPVRVERLVTATPLYTIGGYAHPDLAPLYDEIGARLEAQAGERERPARVFLTRHHPRRGCRNREEVEEVFRAHGFAVVRPESMSFAEQVATVRRAEVIAGFAGSNLLHLGLTGRAKQVVVLASDDYHVHNEHALAVLRGHDLTVVVSRADDPGGGRDADASGSAFVVDPEREGAYLRRVLAELG